MQPNEEAKHFSEGVAGLNYQTGSPPIDDLKNPSPGVGLEFVSQAKALLVENLVLLMGKSESSEQIERYLATIEDLRFESGLKTSIDLKRRTVTLSNSSSESPIGDIAERILRASVTMATADQSPSHRDAKELQKLHLECSPKVSALLQAMRGTEGVAFGLAEDEAKAARLQEIQEYLEPTAEQRAALEEVDKKYRQAFAARPENLSKVAPELAFIAKYLDARRPFVRDTAFTENLWHLFGAPLDGAFQGSTKQELIEKVARVVQSVCNIIAKEYLVKRRNLSAGGGLLLQVTPTQVETIVNLVAVPFEHYLLSRARGGARVATLHAQLVAATASLDIKERLHEPLASAGQFKKSLVDRFKGFDLSASAQARFAQNPQQGLLGTTVQEGVLRLAASAPGTQVSLAGGAGVLRIGSAGSTVAGSAASKNASSPSDGAVPVGRSSLLQPVFSTDRGYAPYYQLLVMLSNSVVQAKQPHDLVANPPSVVSTVFEKLLDEADPENGTIPQWIEHLIAVYERSPLDTPKGTKAVSVVWRALVQKTPEVSKETIAEINATRRAAMGPEAPPITADDISKGYFIACILRGSITGSRDDKKLDHMIRAALQHLYAETGDIAYAMALTHLAALAVVKSEPAGPVLAETPKAPREQKPRLFPWGRKSPDNVQTKTDSPVLHEATVPSVHQGISFDDLRIRVESIGQGTYDKLPLLGFQQQLTELQLLLTGQPDATQLTKLVRQVSPYTHPDQREQRFPEKSLHGALDTIFKGVTSLVPLVESSDVYEEAGAEEALLQVLQGFSELRKREQQLTINRQERSVQEQHAAFSALPEILEVLKQLQSDVAAIKARLGEGAAAPESNLARGREE